MAVAEGADGLIIYEVVFDPCGDLAGARSALA